MIPFSVNLMPEVPVADVVDLAVVAENLGYHRCWVYDEGTAAREVYVTLTAVAAATERVQLGPGITNAFTRHPAVTATAIATLDEFSGGRTFLGIGAGGSLTLAPMRIDARYSLTAVREMIYVCRRLFAGDEVNHDGRYFGLDMAQLDFVRPDIEIWLAGRGPKMLALGGAKADGVMLEFLHRSILEREFARVTVASREAANDARICYSTMIVTSDQAMEVTKAHMTYRLLDSPLEVHELMGIGESDIDAIRNAMSGGLHEAGALMKDEWIEPFVIMGSVDECADQIRDLVKNGVSEFLLPTLQQEGAVELMRTTAQIAKLL